MFGSVGGELQWAGRLGPNRVAAVLAVPFLYIRSRTFAAPLTPSSPLAEVCRRRIGPGPSRMFHYSDYLREQAAKYRELAEKAEDPFVKQEFLELSDVCEEVANNIDDRRASG
jgi:hypothetical protein